MLVFVGWHAILPDGFPFKAGNYLRSSPGESLLSGETPLPPGLMIADVSGFPVNVMTWLYWKTGGSAFLLDFVPSIPPLLQVRSLARGNPRP